MRKILFTGREHRVRRRETILNPPSGITFITQQSIEEMSPDYKLSGTKKNNILQNIKNFIRYNNYIPKIFLKKVDLIYSPGKIILNNFPWVVEIDNVSVLSYYNLWLLRLLKPFIMRKLLSEHCKKIICISEAAKKSLLNYFKDEKLEKKCSVVYPYVSVSELKEKKDDKIRLLYVSTQFYLKGGKEILKVFDKLCKEYDNIELVIISNTPDEMKTAYSKNKRIVFVTANKSKKELYDKYYSQSDIFLQLSFQDSFGLVNLEAISAGLPVITTNIFAIPEIVEDGKNGFILKSPISYFNEDFTPNPEFWNIDINEYACTHDFPDLEHAFEKKLRFLIENGELRKKMSMRSRWLVEEGKFSEKNRLEKLKIALGGNNVRD